MRFYSIILFLFCLFAPVSYAAELQAALTQSTPAADQLSYQEAFSYVDQQNFPRALYAFQDFLSDYPNSDYVPSAYFWMAELYMSEHKTEQALKAYTHLLKAYPHSARTPAAAFKLARLQDKAGQHVEARQAFKRIQQQYPGTTAAQLAHIQLTSS